MFCAKCGNQMNDNDLFCSGCGFRVSEENSSSNGIVFTAKRIEGDFPQIVSKIPLRLGVDEKLIEQHSSAFVMSSIAQGMFSLTNKRIIFTKDSAGKAFLKRGGLIGMALSSGASIPSEISLNEIVKIEPTSCMQSKAAMLITVRSGYRYKIALQSMALGKTSKLCEARDRIVNLIAGIL